MSAQQWNAHELAQTRLCQALNCPDDAAISLDGWTLCTRHERQRLSGKPVELHTLPDAGPPTLRCSSCEQWKPDDEFPHAAPDPAKGGPRTDRRGRHRECTRCGSSRRARARANMHADLLEELRAVDRERWHARRKAAPS